MGRQGLEKVLHPSFHRYPKMAEGDGTEKPAEVPTPPTSLLCAPALYTVLEGLELLGGGGFPPALTLSPSPTFVPGPHHGHSLLLFPPTLWL